MTAATDAWATAENRTQIRQRLLTLDIMARTHPRRDAVIREVAALMGLPPGLPRWQIIDCIHENVCYLNRTMPRPSRIAVCHHEAGHAIVADALGISVRQVSMHAIRNTGGSCLLQPANQQRGLSTPGGALRWCAALAAGPIATRVYHARARKALNEESFVVQKNSDVVQMMRIVSATSRRADWITVAYVTAERLVMAHWPAVTRLALRLYDDHRDLSGNELNVYLRRPSRQHVPLRYGRAWPHELLMRHDLLTRCEGDAGK
jgi:hypothetical protein